MARRVLLGATVLIVVLGGGLVLGRSMFHTAGLRADTAPAGRSPTAAAASHRWRFADFAAAPVTALPRLPASAARGRISLPWRRIAVRHAHLNIVFASRPSCEQLSGVVVKQTASSVTINVLARNIVNAPNCDLVPKLKQAVVRLAAPLAARSLRHDRLDAAYWPTDPFTNS